VLASGAAVPPAAGLTSCPAALGCPAARSVAVEDPGTLDNVFIVKLLEKDVEAFASALAEEAEIDDKTRAGSGAFGPSAIAGTLPTCFCCELAVCVCRGWAAAPLAVSNEEAAAIWPVGGMVVVMLRQSGSKVEVSLRARGCLDAMCQYSGRDREWGFIPQISWA
jgi:hypothetical protein